MRAERLVGFARQALCLMSECGMWRVFVRNRRPNVSRVKFRRMSERSPVCRRVSRYRFLPSRMRFATDRRLPVSNVEPNDEKGGCVQSVG